MYGTLAILYLCGGLALLLTVAFPINRHAPVHLDLVIGLIACLLGLTIGILGRRIPRSVLRAQVMVGPVMSCVIVAHARTGTGVALAAFAYPWLVAYTAHFFDRRTLLVQATVITVGLGVSIHLNDLPHLGPLWVIVSATVWIAGLVQGKLSRTLHSLADTDQLTGLLNRNGLHTAALRERAVATRMGSALTVALIDLDNFKQVNDREGHGAGDRALAHLATAFRAHLRPGDTIARHGGDEFLLLLPATTLDEAGIVLERLRAPAIPLSWSAGVSEWLPGEDFEVCIRRADESLYAAKREILPKQGEIGGLLFGSMGNTGEEELLPR